MRALLATVALLLVSGCVADDPEPAGPGMSVAGEPSDVPAAAPPLPDAFTVEHRFPTAVQVGGIVVGHGFALAVPATLHLGFAAEVPEAVVALEVRDGSGVVFSELVPAPVPEAFDGIQRDVVLEPGAYTATAQVYGYGTAKSFSLSGSFTAR